MFGLGDLESIVMEQLWWAEEPQKVRDVLDRLNEQRRYAYTTVMTVLDNLHRKGWVLRELDGKAYRYRPAYTREEAAAAALREVLSASGDPEGALLHFARSASEDEAAALRDGLRGKGQKE